MTSPGSSRGRSSDSASDSGLSSRGEVGAPPSASSSAGATNGGVVTSSSPAAASARDAVRRSACSGVSPRPAGAEGRADGHGVVALEPDDLLDEVDRRGEVGPPGRDGDGEHVALAGHLAADVDQPAADDGGLVRAAGDPAGQVDRQRDGDRRGPGVDVGAAARGGAAELDEQPHGRLRSGGGERRVDGALEALARLARQPVPAGGARDAHRARSGPPRARPRSWTAVTSVLAPPMTPARPIAPESSAMTRSPGSSARSCPSSVVSRSPGAARRTTIAPDSRARSYACSGCPSSSMTELVTSTARLIGAHAGQDEPALQPGRGGRGRVQAGDGAGDEAVAAGRVLDAHRVAVLRRRHVDQARVGERQPEGGGGLPGDAAHRELVAAVRRDGEVEHLVAQREQLDDVGPERRSPVQHEDAVGVVGQPELGGGADHPVGGVAVRPAGGDPEVAGQHGARGARTRPRRRRRSWWPRRRPRGRAHRRRRGSSGSAS